MPSGPAVSLPPSCGSSPPLAEPSLFLVVLGGRAAGCHLELHDVRFVAGTSLEATLPELRRQWFGSSRGLHLDAFLAVRAVDGWTVRLRPEPPVPRPERLWFVNLGAYRPDSLAELHHFGLVVARSPRGAKAVAKRRWLGDALQQHRDDLWAVDDCLALERLAPAASVAWHVALEPHPQGWSQPQVPDWFGYRPI